MNLVWAQNKEPLWYWVEYHNTLIAELFNENKLWMWNEFLCIKYRPECFFFYMLFFSLHLFYSSLFNLFLWKKLNWDADIKEFASGHPTSTECGTFSELIINFEWFK